MSSGWEYWIARARLAEARIEALEGQVFELERDKQILAKELEALRERDRDCVKTPPPGVVTELPPDKPAHGNGMTLHQSMLGVLTTASDAPSTWARQCFPYAQK